MFWSPIKVGESQSGVDLGVGKLTIIHACLLFDRDDPVHLMYPEKGGQRFEHLGVAWVVCLGSTPSREDAPFQPLEIIDLGILKGLHGETVGSKEGNDEFL